MAIISEHLSKEKSKDLYQIMEDKCTLVSIICVLYIFKAYEYF